MTAPMNPLATLALLVLLPAACVPFATATAGGSAGGVDPNLAVRSEVAQVCVVCPAPPAALPGTTYQLRDDGRLVGSMRGPSYLCWDASPGAHHLTSEAPPHTATIEVTLVAGHRTFLRQSSAALDLVAEPEARAALADVRLAALDAPPGQAPLAVAAGDRPGAPVQSAGSRPAPASPQRRPDGVAYGAAAGLGGGLGRAASAINPSPGFAALGSIWIGYSALDLVLVGLRIDVGLVGSGGTGDVALHLAGFPAGRSRGPIRDFLLFADAGIGGPVSLSNGLSFGAGGVAGIGRVGVGWEGWRIRSAVLGPFLAAETERGPNITQTAALTGLWLSLYADPRQGLTP